MGSARRTCRVMTSQVEFGLDSVFLYHIRVAGDIHPFVVLITGRVGAVNSYVPYVCVRVQLVAVISWVQSATLGVINRRESAAVSVMSPDDSATSAW